MPNESRTILERLEALDSTVVSDALDGLGLPAGLGGFRSVWGSPRIVGRARTVALEPDHGQVAGPHLATSVVASAQPGDVLVMSNGGRLDVSCWGGILSLGSVGRGVAGVIADGACRDVAEAEELANLLRERRRSPASPPRRRPARPARERVR